MSNPASSHSPVSTSPALSAPPKSPILELSKPRFHDFIAIEVILVVFIVCCIVAFWLVRRNLEAARRRKREEMEMKEMEYWPHRFANQKIEAATNSFSEENVIGIGGNGKVYRGTLPGGERIAVKRVLYENCEGIRTFLAAIPSLGWAKHRNLVGLKGWCKDGEGGHLVVYEFMDNGSLENKVLSYLERVNILKQVASALLHLHHGLKAKVLHGGIKASNVLLDKEMNARIGDYELVRVNVASCETDVFSYGVLVLEVMSGRRAVEEGKPALVEWVSELLRRGEFVKAVDYRVDEEEEADRVLRLGLMCVHPDTRVRPTMREVVKFFEGSSDHVCEFEGEDLHLLTEMKTNEFWSAILVT